MSSYWDARNIAPGVTETPQPGFLLKLFTAVHLVLVPLMALGWVAFMAKTFTRAGWDAAEEFFNEL